jgi:hypothetical protein
MAAMEEITELINRLYLREVGDKICGPTAEDQLEVPQLLLTLADQSTETRDRVIQALIDSLEYSADGDDRAFYIVSDLLGKLRAVEAIDALVKYIDYQPARMGLSLNSAPAVRGLIRIGEKAVPQIGEALISGKSLLHEGEYLLRWHAVRALMHIGGDQSKAILRKARLEVADDRLKGSIEFALQQIEAKEAKRASGGPRIEVADGL